MKSGIHPENYRTVVFKDMSNGDTFFSLSTVTTKENIEIVAPVPQNDAVWKACEN